MECGPEQSFMISTVLFADANYKSQKYVLSSTKGANFGAKHY